MAEQLKQRVPRLTPKSKLLAKEKRKEKNRQWSQSRHVVRLTDATWEKWNNAKSMTDLDKHDDFADKLLDVWNMGVAKRHAQKTPEKKAAETALFSTPIHTVTSGPSFPVSDISESSAGSGSEVSDADIVNKYLEKAKQTDKSFIEISFETHPSKTTDKSYHLASDEECSEDDDDDDISDYDEIEDFEFDMSLRIEQDDEKVPVSGIAESLMDIEASDSNEELSDSDTEASDNPDADLVKERKFVCFESQIMKLCRLSVSSLCNRKGCSATVNTTTKSRGTAIKISWVCTSGHQIKTWDSQPILRRMYAGDILMSAAILLSGNNFEKTRLLFSFFGMGMTAKSTHYKIQTKHSCPVIEEKFCEVIDTNMRKYAGKEIVVIGDGRMDSPGHSAQYCTYTLMENSSKDIVASVIIDKRMTDLKSSNMELEGLRRCLQKLQDGGVVVKELVTDASTSIAAMMRKNKQEITHTFDTWHGAKNFGKRLGSVAGESRNKELRPWVSHLINHFWYCCRTANGDESVLLARWRGALHHVVNIHEWISGDGAIIPKCQHEDLPDEPSRNWLQPGSDPHVALARVMLDTRFLHNLHRYVNFRHTGELETLHEHILMYCAKRFAYAYPAYKARNRLAVVDYQAHKDRPYLQNKNGEFRLHRCFSKRSGTYSCYKEKVPKSYSYIETLQNSILTSVLERQEPLRAPVTMSPSDPRRIKRTLSGISPPPTKYLMEKKRSRFEGGESSSQ